MGLASVWADRLIGLTRMALSRDKNVRGYFHGTSACLSSLLAARRYDEILELVEGTTFWPYKRWAVKALVAQRRPADALRFAENCRNPWASDAAIDAVCEQILLSTGEIDDAYARYRLPRTGPEPTSPGSDISRSIGSDQREKIRAIR